MTYVSKAASLMGRKSAKARAAKWGKKEFVRRMREWGKLGGRPKGQVRKKELTNDLQSGNDMKGPYGVDKCGERGSCGVYWYKFMWKGEMYGSPRSRATTK